MKIVHSSLGHVAVLSPAGELSVNSDFGALHTSVGNAIDDSVLGVFVDLDGVSRLDCRAIGQLVDLRRRVEAAGRAFCLIGLAPRPRQMLETLRLIEVLRVCDDETEAAQRVARFVGVAWGTDRGPRRRSERVSDSSSPAVRSSWLGRPVGWRPFLPPAAPTRRSRRVEEATWPPLL